MPLIDLAGRAYAAGGRWRRRMDRGEEDRFRAFVVARSASLLSFAHLLTGDRHEAEDLVQTALAKTALAWPRLRRQDNPEGYVRRTIVTSQLNVWRRKRWRERATDMTGPDADGEAGPGRDAAAGGDAAGELDERDAMWRALRTLAPRQRAVLVLRYYEDLSEAEIAEVLGCSRGTVKSQAARALTRLRSVVELEGAQP